MKKSMILLGMLSIGYANAQSTDPYEGRVGINTAEPSASLSVKTRDDSKSPKNLELQNQAGTKLVTVLNNGNVGINTVTPVAKLDVAGNIRVKTDASMWLDGKTSDIGITSSVPQTTTGYHPFLRQTTSSGHVVNLGGLGDVFGFYGYLNDRTENGYDHALVMNVATGNIGVGTGAPTAKLDVAGKIKITDGTQQAGRVLTSDANGLASWESLSIGNKIAHIRFHDPNFSTIPGIRTDSLEEEVYSVSTIDIDEIGVTANNKGFTLPKGRYIVYQTHDLDGMEYCGIATYANSDKNELYRSYYSEWFNGSYLINLVEDDNNIYFKIKCFKDTPNNSFYNGEGYYNDLRLYNTITVLKLN